MNLPKKRRGSKGLIFILAAAALLSGAIFWGGSKAAAGFTVSPVDLSLLTDGVYTGNAELLPVKVTVEVSVTDHRISDIRIVRHDNGIGFRAEDQVVREILARQTPVVDTVAGASVSSKAIMKAVENALRPQPR